jgi:hypothetical protein
MFGFRSLTLDGRLCWVTATVSLTLHGSDQPNTTHPLAHYRIGYEMREGDPSGWCWRNVYSRTFVGQSPEQCSQLLSNF